MLNVLKIIRNIFVTRREIAKLLIAYDFQLCIGESCTGGLLSSFLTDISGSSNYISQNFVTYSNESKQKYLKVKKETIEIYGVVSSQVAKEMAKGLLENSMGNIAICTTGYLGPKGGPKGSPNIGTMFVSIGNLNHIEVKEVKMPSFLPRKLMKYCFCVEATEFLYSFLKKFFKYK